MDANPQKSNYPPQSMSKKSARNFLVMILILAFFGLLGGYWSIKTSIEQPLAFTKNANSSQIAALTNSKTDTSLEGLKTKDSDKDGLSDYDELNTYGTSPYLADSDSDGKTDKQEIDAKTDPNCPEGKPCTAIALFTPTFSTNTNTSAATANGNANTAAPSTTINVAELRNTLRNAGAPQADLDALSDADLLALYDSVVKEEQTNVNAVTNAAPTNTNSSASATSIELQQLSNLTPTEIRALLKSGGADDATLQSVDDATLKQIFLESLQNAK